MATTPKGYPYPTGTDRVVDGDNAIQALATAIDTVLGLWACGQVTIPITAPQTATAATVTFPASRFTAPPQVQATLVCQGVAVTNARQPSVAPSPVIGGCTIYGFREAGTNTFPVSWWAVQL